MDNGNLLKLGIIIVATVITIVSALSFNLVLNKLPGNSFGSAFCSGQGSVNLTALPMNVSDIQNIQPMGEMIGGHVTPIDHLYFSPVMVNATYYSYYPVYSPAAGVITDIENMTQTTGNATHLFRVIIYHTCTFYTIFILISKLSPSILSAAGEIPMGGSVSVAIPITAGEQIGVVGGHTLDFSIVNTQITDPGFANVSDYISEPWKVHTVDPTYYFVPQIRNEFLSKDVRNNPPYGGKIDFDIVGKIVGNWFKDGSNGYAGFDNGGPDYWASHISIAYNILNLSQIIISLGNFSGSAQQFNVFGNSPDPATIGKSNGTVEYQLVQFNPFLSNITTTSNRIEGTVLFRLLQNYSLKVQVFPGENSSQVTGFTNKALLYYR